MTNSQTDSTKDLQQSLATFQRTNAEVSSLIESQYATKVALDYWLNTYRARNWRTITVDLTLEWEIMEEVSPVTLTRNRHPPLAGLDWLGLAIHDRPTLIIYTTDPLTERFIHDMVNHLAESDSTGKARILHLIRCDGTAQLDIG